MCPLSGHLSLTCFLPRIQPTYTYKKRNMVRTINSDFGCVPRRPLSTNQQCDKHCSLHLQGDSAATAMFAEKFCTAHVWKSTLHSQLSRENLKTRTRVLGVHRSNCTCCHLDLLKTTRNNRWHKADGLLLTDWYFWYYIWGRFSTAYIT
jgi:hypothetical protein